MIGTIILLAVLCLFALAGWTLAEHHVIELQDELDAAQAWLERRVQEDAVARPTLQVFDGERW